MDGFRVSVSSSGFDRMRSSKIAEKLGMSRNTVAPLVGLEEPPRYERRRWVPSWMLTGVRS